MAYTITKSLSSDFGGNLGVEYLENQIRSSSIIVTEYYGLLLSGDDVIFYFASTLSAPELTEFNTIISNYTYVKDPSDGLVGAEYHYAEDDIESNTISLSYVQKLRLNANTLLGGTYKINWTYNWNLDSNNENFLSQIQIDDSTTIMSQTQMSMSSNAMQSYPVSGFKVMDLTEGDHIIDLDFATSSITANAYIRDARLEIFRIK